MPMRDIARQLGYLYRQCAIIAVLILVLHSVFVLIVTRVLIRPLRGLLARRSPPESGADPAPLLLSRRPLAKEAV